MFYFLIFIEIFFILFSVHEFAEIVGGLNKQWETLGLGSACRDML